MTRSRPVVRTTIHCLLGLFLGTEAIAREDADLGVLRAQLEALEQRDRDRQRQLDDLQHELRNLRDQAAAPEAPPVSANDDLWSTQLTPGTRVRLMDVGINLLMAAGASDATDAELANLQGHGHDPRQRGFTFQQLELSMLGAVDPYFTAAAHLIYFIDPSGESRFELEEAFATSTTLPYGLQLEAGHFFTEFGRLNPQHAHQWQWQDAPIVNVRMFGEDGMRAPGVRLGWLAPLPWYSELHFGLQNARGETMSSFLASDEIGAIGGRPWIDRETNSFNDLVYLVRWLNGIDITDTISSQLGVSFLRGPNGTGDDGRTDILGGDLVVKWQPLTADRGWPFVVFEAEAMVRDYRADGFSGPFDGGPPDDDDDLVVRHDNLRDHGLYAQLLYGFTRGWAFGVRGEYASGSGMSFDVAGRRKVPRADDPFRDDRYRISPLLVWQPSEFSRLRLQYNYDWADHLDDAAHSVWLGLDISLGAHPAHSY